MRKQSTRTGAFSKRQRNIPEGRGHSIDGLSGQAATRKKDVRNSTDVFALSASCPVTVGTLRSSSTASAATKTIPITSFAPARFPKTSWQVKRAATDNKVSAPDAREKKLPTASAIPISHFKEN